MLKYNFIHFVGIGGISMSGLAEIMLSRGCRISGSDLHYSSLVEHLVKLGAEVQIGHSEQIISNQDLMVFSSAIHSDNPEYKKALAIGMKILERADFLGELMQEYEHAIAVAGTHGKTTTTGFMSSILLKADKDPTILLGGEFDLINGNLRIGGHEFLLTEACEYKRSFVKFNPQYGIVLNIEEDHLDYYKNLEDIKSAFHEFAEKINEYGYLIYNRDCKHSKDLFLDLKCKAMTFGLSKEADVYAGLVVFSPFPHYELFVNGISKGEIALKVPGLHNVYNSLASATCALCMNLPLDSIIAGIEGFTGTKRRFEYKGICKGAIVVDDYAHHPTEIKATLSAINNMNYNNCLCVFQPHTYTRTLSLLNEFALSFEDANLVLIVDIYPAREIDDGSVHAKDLVEKLIQNNVNAIYCHSFQEAESYFLEHAQKDDLILTMGAGDVYLIGEHIIKSQ